MLEQNITFAGAFLAGILSFLSPCILPLLPGYISFISGESVESLTNNEGYSPRLKAFLGAVFFGIGFTLIFVLLGATATEIGKALQSYKFLLEKIAGVIVIILGLHLFGVFKINKLLVQKKVSYKKRNAPFFIEAFLLGIAFVLGWTPCIGPILSGILALAAKESTASSGMFLLFVYSLGLWIPFLISALFVSEVMKAIKKAGKVMIIVEKISGVLLITIGILILSGSMSKLVALFYRITG
jgi:cytochrome c-type biogenesis protein